MSNPHEDRVRRVADQVKARPAGKRLTIGKAHPGHTPHDLGYKAGAHAVAVGELDAILAIDREARTASVEGQVKLGDLCRATLALGLMPKVVPEFETFTVSGLVNGLGIETSSHRHGVFPSTASELEVVLGNGDVVRASATENVDLFRMLPGSYGTLGIVTRVTLELSDAKPYVRSRYRHFEQRGAYVAAFGEALAKHEFVEGFVLSPRSYVLITADYADRDAGLPVWEAMTYGNEWYFRHAEAMAKRGGEDLIPSYEYMFRHQRGLFWLSEVVADLRILTRTRWGRRHVDREVERAVRTTGFTNSMPPEVQERSVFNQDMGVRLSRLEEGIDYVQKNIGVYPLWNCAVAPPRTEGFAVPKAVRERPEMLVDIGVYGEPTKKGIRCFDALRALQSFVDSPALWGVSYLTRDELRARYDFDAYEAAQRKYHAADAFVPLESKIRFASIAPDADQSHIKWWRLVRVKYEMRAKRAAAEAAKAAARAR